MKPYRLLLYTLAFFIPCFAGECCAAESYVLYPNRFEIPDASGRPALQRWTLLGEALKGGSSEKSNAYEIRSQTFWDAARRRAIPTRIYAPSDHAQKHPVVIFSHGLGGSPDCCAYLGKAWAARGFFVVMLQHPGSDENVWKGKLRILRELEQAYRANWTGRTRASDICCVLDQLERLARRGDPLARRMDFDRIGVGGYDLGSLAALLVAGQLPPDNGVSLHDPRVKAVLAMSPPVTAQGKSFQDIYAPITAPCFFITGTKDDGIVGSTQAHQRRIPFDFLGETDRYLVTMRGADHRVYGGRVLSVRARNDKEFQALIVRSSTCFWQAVLQEKTAAKAMLSSAGLNAMFRGLALVEKRLQASDRVETSTAVAETDVPQEKIGSLRSPKTVERKPEPVFPTTRLYRNLAKKYAASGPY